MRRTIHFFLETFYFIYLVLISAINIALKVRKNYKLQMNKIKIFKYSDLNFVIISVDIKDQVRIMTNFFYE